MSHNKEMRAALLGVNDSLRQARLFPLEPLAMFACLTAEEEAATFLYYTLREKGYALPDYNKLHGHFDKTKILLLATALVDYFFNEAPEGFVSIVRVERDGEVPRTFRYFKSELHQVIIKQLDPLETVKTQVSENDGHDAAVQMSVEKTLSGIIPKGYTLKSHLKSMANRRNHSIYGDPEKKLRLKSETEVNKFETNCASIITTGFLVLNGTSKTSSMQKLVTNVFDAIEGKTPKKT